MTLFIRVRDLSHAGGSKDHYARSVEKVPLMRRRVIHPLLMGLDKPNRQVELTPLERPDTLRAGLESPQHKRFLRAEAEQETQLNNG